MATIDERPFCRDCDGYISGGTGVDEPVCCCDSDDESDDEPTSTEILCEENGIPTPEEYELLPPDEQKLMYLKLEAKLEATRAETDKIKLKLNANKIVEHQRIMAAGAVKIAELEAKLEAKGLLTEAELEAKTKKPKKIKLKLKPKKKVIKLKFKKSVK